LRKRSLMLSTAAVALLSGAAYATDTTIDSAKTEPYTTGPLITSPANTGQHDQGNITVKSTGSIAVGVENQGVITVNTDNWVLNQGALSNKDKDGAHGIHIDLSADRNLSGASFANTAGSTVTGSGIYFDNASSLSISGDGTGKIGIYLDGSSCTATACTYTGDVTLSAGSALSVTGDGSDGVVINAKSILKGNLTFAGTTDIVAATTTNASVTGVYGLLSTGLIQGNVLIPTGGQLAVQGHGARGISIQGTGVDGYISIGGGLSTGIVAETITSYNQKVNTTTNAEAGPALEIGASVTHGIAILGPSIQTSSGQVSVNGTGQAILISPTINTTVTTPTGPLTIGVFTGDTVNPGFSFYNRGTVAIQPTNYNDSAVAFAAVGYDASRPTVLQGGFFNSGTMGASATSSTAGVSGATAPAVLGVYIGDYAQLLPGSGKNGPSGTANPGDQAAFVNSGAVSSTSGISASVSGSRGGTAQAISISSLANVPSLINTGTIAARATTTDAALAGNTTSSADPLYATAITDRSGTLTSIYNAGTISAVAGYEATSNSSVSPLDNNTQRATAIDLTGGALTPASVQIKNYASNSRAAVISGDVLFGSGNNQQLLLQGSNNYASSVTGNVVFGNAASGSLTSGDLLSIGAYSTLTGAVVTSETLPTAGVAVDVQAHGTLTLLNNSDALKPLGINCTANPGACVLNSSTFNVATGGTVNLGLNQVLTANGTVVSAQSVNFASGSSLGVAYASFVPQSARSYVLMTAKPGQLTIDQGTLDGYNNGTSRPYLLKETHLSVVHAGTIDQLVLNLIPKNETEIGLTPGSIAFATVPKVTGGTTSLFEQANIAMASDDALGSAFINGITNAAQAQQAYNNMAPNLTGGTRAIVISITDQATGPVGAHQRALNMYGKTDGDMTLWGQQFVQMLKDPGKGSVDVNTGFKTSPGFKDHGFGFVLGVDSGSPKYGWYGGAFTFYAGDVNELSRTAHENQQWYLLSLYSVWRGKGLFLDTKLDVGYGHVDGKRSISLVQPSGSAYIREADNKHAGALIAGGMTTGMMFSYGAMTLMPQLSVDGMYMREEGYTEYNPSTTTIGDGFDLKVNPYYAKSLRAFLGADIRYDLELWDFFLQPEARVGYRYDFISDPVKLRAAFAYSNVTTNSIGPGSVFELTGPDPSQGNFVLGGAIASTTDTWTLGLNFDVVRGSNGAYQQVGTISILGRI
jgi:hypothetical protein